MVHPKTKCFYQSSANSETKPHQGSKLKGEVMKSYSMQDIIEVAKDALNAGYNQAITDVIDILSKNKPTETVKEEVNHLWKDDE